MSAIVQAGGIGAVLDNPLGGTCTKKRIFLYCPIHRGATATIHVADGRHKDMTCTFLSNTIGKRSIARWIG